MDTDNDKYIFNVKTVQSGAFRILIESLKEILTDTNIIFDSISGFFNSKLKK